MDQSNPCNSPSAASFRRAKSPLVIDPCSSPSAASFRPAKSPLASPVSHVRATSPSSPMSIIGPAPGRASPQLKRSSAPARTRNGQKFCSSLRQSALLRTTLASSPPPVRANLAPKSQSRAPTPGQKSKQGTLRNTSPCASRDVAAVPATHGLGVRLGPSIVASASSTSLREDASSPKRSQASNVGTQSVSACRRGPSIVASAASLREDSPSPKRSQASNFGTQSVSACRLGPSIVTSTSSLREDYSSPKRSRASNVGTQSVRAFSLSPSPASLVSVPQLAVQKSMHTQPAVSVRALSRHRHRSASPQSPRIVTRSIAAQSQAVRSNSPLQSPPPTCHWQRIGTVLKATHAFAQTLTERKSMPQALAQPTQPAQALQQSKSVQVAHPGKSIAMQGGSLQVPQHQPRQWQKVGAVMRASRAFSESLTASLKTVDASTSAGATGASVSSLAAVGEPPPNIGTETLRVGLSGFKAGASLQVCPGSISAKVLAGSAQLSIGSTGGMLASVPSRPNSVSVPAQLAQQYVGRRSPYPHSSAPAMSSAPFDFRFQHVSPRGSEPSQPKLETIVTGEVLATDTTPLESGDFSTDVVATSTVEEVPPHAVGVAGDVSTTPEVDEMPSHVRDTLENISKMLNDRECLKATVIKNFKAARHDEAVQPQSLTIVEDIENATVNKFEFYIFVDLISKAMDLPPYAFGNLELEYAAFDFNGHGTLNIKETYKFVKFHLKEYRRELGGKAAASVNIPTKTLAEAGYDVLEVLGRGSQGFAKLAKNSSGHEVCLKVFDKKQMRDDEFYDMVEEFESMQLLSCKCIAGANEMFQDSLNYFIACELYRGGDFSQLTEKATEQDVIIDEEWYCGIFRQCFEGIKFMHEQAVMHCDIKEHNLMLKTTDFSNPEVVIIDLGVSNCLAASGEGIPQGTPGYVPPETLETLTWFPAGDTFSMGVTMFQVVADMKPPDHGLFIDGCTSAKEIFKATLEREPPWSMLPESEMPGLKKLLQQVLEKDRDQRPRPTKVLKHYWFTGVHAEEEPGVKSAELTKNVRDFYIKMAPTNQFATMGFTASMVQGYDEEDEEEPRAKTAP